VNDDHLRIDKTHPASILLTASGGGVSKILRVRKHGLGRRRVREGVALSCRGVWG